MAGTVCKLSAILFILFFLNVKHLFVIKELQIVKWIFSRCIIHVFPELSLKMENNSTIVNLEYSI